VGGLFLNFEPFRTTSRRVRESAVAAMASSTPRRRDGVSTTPRHRDAVDATARESTRLAKEQRQSRDGIHQHRSSSIA